MNMNCQKLKIIYHLQYQLQNKLQHYSKMANNLSSARRVSCIVYYKPGLFDHEIERVENIYHQIQHFRNSDHYIKDFIDHIKHNVIKKYPNLSLIQIELFVFDRSNILHRLIVNVGNIIRDILNIKEQFCVKKTVFIIVTYEHQIVFAGGLGFKGII